jgi:hypothetical protein
MYSGPNEIQPIPALTEKSGAALAADADKHIAAARSTA